MTMSKIKINENKITDYKPEIVYYTREVYSEIREKQKELLDSYKFVVIKIPIGNEP